MQTWPTDPDPEHSFLSALSTLVHQHYFCLFVFAPSIFTMLFFTIALFAASTLVIAAPLPDGGSAYTGAGGQAIGGTAGNNGDNGFGADALNIASGNAGDGGDASSGTAFGGFGGR